MNTWTDNKMFVPKSELFFSTTRSGISSFHPPDPAMLWPGEEICCLARGWRLIPGAGFGRGERSVEAIVRVVKIVFTKLAWAVLWYMKINYIYRAGDNLVEK